MTTKTDAIGLLPKQMIVDQLTHVAVLQGHTAETLAEAGLPTWNVLASIALGLNLDARSIELAVLAQLRDIER